MSTRIWKGGTAAVAQVDTLTVGGTVEADDVFNIILTGEDGTTTHTLAVVAGSTTIATVCTTIRDAFNAETDALFTPITASATATTVVLTADVAGVPFTCTVTTTEDGGGGADQQTFVRTVGTANASTTCFKAAANWVGGVAPVDGDAINIPATATYGIAGTDATAAGTVDFIGFTSELGRTGNTGDSTTPLKISLKNGTTYYDLNWATTSGQHFLSITNYGDLFITGAPSSPGEGEYGLNIKATTDATSATSGRVFVACTSNQSIGLAANAGETGEFNAVTVTGGEVTIGSSVTDYNAAASTTITVYGGSVTNYSAMATVTNRGGKFYGETGAIATVNTYTGGTSYMNGPVTWTACNIYDSGVVDCRTSFQDRTITTLHLYGKGGKFYDLYAIVTQTNPFQVHDYQLSDVTVQVGNAKKFTVAAI